MMELKKLKELICEATQKTNYNCITMCDDKGSCAYCTVIAEHIHKNQEKTNEKTNQGKTSIWQMDRY